jgi:hypothetical protein
MPPPKLLDRNNQQRSPPACRGRANVTTEDMSVFTKQSQQAARRGSSGSAGGPGAAGS